ncbi:MAG: DUF1707 and DUF2154 domain-containing protein [Gemmatimonadetes bacterium]|nr:DUF1707 domain-containing protein [Gemmatimonadota bacterium]NNM03525.1 DUF1707 and DUF2154 domain-containing protein [Gemmatimonadota bacterium]
MTEVGGGDVGSTRQKAIDALCEHFANDALSVEEFERRVDEAHKAESQEEIKALLSDLPSGDLPVRKEDVGTTAIQRPRASVPASRVKERSFQVAVLSGTHRKGRWIPARQNYAFSVMGGITLDFREALLPPGETEVWIFTAMGGAEIIVPPGLPVECEGLAILGGWEHRENAAVSPDPDAPILRVRGLALMGGVEVTTRFPGETNREAKRRRRFERKEKKRSKRLGDGS